ncbi:2202_t:CDS:2 [Paraglomus occultum]|uniref:2202_t:CDS:1 n=1 Tax=Paraglomus occultum TaxID=144539 RepID=A0A9N9FH54_9GLOM|nr:2202_t:CDS:2 [Paraglomus occultum]
MYDEAFRYSVIPKICKYQTTRPDIGHTLHIINSKVKNNFQIWEANKSDQYTILKEQKGNDLRPARPICVKEIYIIYDVLTKFTVIYPVHPRMHAFGLRFLK